MFHITEEGGAIRNGFNFYPLKDRNNFGFRFRYGPKLPLTNLGSKIFWFRFSKNAKRLFVGVE